MGWRGEVPGRGGPGRGLAVLLLVLAFGGLAARAQEQPPDVEEVLRRLDDLYRSSASVGRIELTVISPGATRTLRLKAWTKGEEKSLVVIEAPAREAGIATLRVGDNLWNYLPRIARTIRVPASMMLSSWMGTDFTNDDLVKESSYRRDFTSRIEGRSEEPAGWLIVSEVKPGVVGRWAKLEMVVNDEGTFPLEIRYFDRRGRLARTLTFDDVQKMGNRRIPAHLTLVPEGEEGKRTEMRYLDVRFNADVPEDTFSLSRLERSR